jgi:predicted ATP-grasp superfamily ATP-dependent carboligase
MTRVLLAGVSTRGFAESAARAGYEVVAVDGFGDLDLRACAAEVRVVRVDGRFSPRAAAAAVRDVRCDAAVYESSFDNHPGAVRALAADRTLWGNAPVVVTRARDPRRLARVLRDAGVPGPRVRFTRPPAREGSRWMLKPLRSGGGQGVAVWRRSDRGRVPRGMYFQQRIAGIAGSIVFAANGRDAVPLGLSRILAGEARFGADGFRYCGNILAPAGDAQFPGDDRLFAGATLLARVVTRAFGLVGVNGVDFIAHRGLPHAIEVNPRYTAAMELVERAYGVSVFDVHARACGGVLPAFDLAAARRRAPEAVGKAILYARRPIALGDTRPWLADGDLRDISPPDTTFAERDPICTIFARGRSAGACLSALARRAGGLYRDLAGREARSA